MSVAIQPVYALSHTPIVWDTTIGSMETAASLSASVYRDETVYLSAVLINDAADAEFTAEVSIPGLVVDVKFVQVMIRSKNAWSDYVYGSDVAPNPVDGKLVPVLLVNNPHLVRTVDNADPKLSHSYLKMNDGSEELITERVSSETDIQFMVPDFEVDDAATLQPVTLVQDRNQQVFIKVTVGSVAAGDYSGSLVVKQAGSQVATAAITVSVANLTLLPTPLSYNLYHHGKLSPELGVPSCAYARKSTVQNNWDMANLAAHNTNFLSYQPVDDTGDNADLKEHVAARQTAGIDNTEFFSYSVTTHGVDTQPAIDALQIELNKMQEVLTPYGTETVVVYAEDEGDQAAIISQYPAFDMVHAEGGEIFASTKVSDIQYYIGHADHMVVGKSPALSISAEVHAQGAKCYSYADPQAGAEDPSRHRLNYGLMLWSGNFDGAYNYAYQRTMGHPWNDMSGRTSGYYRDHYMTYPTLGGGINMISMPGWLAGQQDSAIMAMLDTAILQNPVAAETPAATVWRDNLRVELQAQCTPEVEVPRGYDPDIQAWIAQAKVYYEAIMPETSNLLTDSFNTLDAPSRPVMTQPYPDRFNYSDSPVGSVDLGAPYWSSNAGPLFFREVGLPFGLTMDENTGIVTGTSSGNASANVDIYATNNLGETITPGEFVWKIEIPPVVVPPEGAGLSLSLTLWI